MAVRVQIYYLWSGRTTLLHVYVLYACPGMSLKYASLSNISMSCPFAGLAGLAGRGVAKWRV